METYISELDNDQKAKSIGALARKVGAIGPRQGMAEVLLERIVGRDDGRGERPRRALGDELAERLDEVERGRPIRSRRTSVGK